MGYSWGIEYVDRVHFKIWLAFFGNGMNYKQWDMLIVG